MEQLRGGFQAVRRATQLHISVDAMVSRNGTPRESCAPRSCVGHTDMALCHGLRTLSPLPRLRTRVTACLPQPPNQGLQKYLLSRMQSSLKLRTLPGKNKEELWACGPWLEMSLWRTSHIIGVEGWKAEGLEETPRQRGVYPDILTWALSFSVPLAGFFSVSGRAAIFGIFMVEIWFVWPF